MKMKIFAVFALVAALGDSCGTNPPGPPPVVVPVGISECAQACAKIGPEGLNCKEGHSVRAGGDASVSCTKFCEDTMSAGVNLSPHCILTKVSKCTEIETLCAPHN